MLERQDIKMIETMMRTVLKENSEELETCFDKKLEERLKENNEDLEARFDKKLEERLKENNEELETCFDKKLTHSESFLLDEMERYHKESMKEIRKVDKKLDEITQFYRIKRIEDDTNGYLLQLYHKQQQEIDEIKMVIGL